MKGKQKIKQMDIVALKSRFSRLAEKSAITGKPKKTVELLRQISDWIQPVFSFETEECEYECPDRTGSFLYGWPWTCPEYPLTLGDYAPFLQLNLDEISQLTGKDFGGGLLQVVFDGGGADFYTGNTPIEPITASARIVPRSMLAQYEEPEIFPGRYLSPYDALKDQDIFWDSFTGQEIVRPDDETADSSSMAALQFSFDVDVEHVLEEWCIRGVSERFGPAESIVKWHDDSDTYYEDIANMLDRDILRACEMNDNIVQLMSNVLGPYYDSKGLFAWPHMYPDHWPLNGRPFMVLNGPSTADFMDYWEILYCPIRDSDSQEDRFEFHSFGMRYHP